MAIQLTATVECIACFNEFEGHWIDKDADTIEDVAEAPVADQTCPNCNNTQEETYPGWMFHTEAG
jgi:hypothetical protein